MEPYRPTSRHRRRADAAARLHDLQPRADSGPGEILLHRFQVTADHWLDVGVESRDAGPLVFAKRRIDLAGQRDHQLGMQMEDDLSGAQLVRRVDEREQVTDRDSFDPRLRKLADRLRDRGLVERNQHLASGTDTLGHLLAEGSGGEEYRRLRFEHEIVHRAPHLAADFEHVLEPQGRD